MDLSCRINNILVLLNSKYIFQEGVPSIEIWRDDKRAEWNVEYSEPEAEGSCRPVRCRGTGDSLEEALKDLEFEIDHALFKYAS
jgi:hypothetical protein